MFLVIRECCSSDLQLPSSDENIIRVNIMRVKKGPLTLNVVLWSQFDV